MAINTDMAMTSSNVYGASQIHDPLRGPPPSQEPAAPTNEQIIRENIERFIKGEITGEQLQQIKNSLN